MHVPAGERPVVWLSFHPHWEPTATPGQINGEGERVDMTFEELCKLSTPARIAIDRSVAPLNWKAWLKQSSVKPEVARGLLLSAVRMGSKVEDWRMSFEPIGQKHWIAIEFFVNGRWTDSAEAFPKK